MEKFKFSILFGDNPTLDPAHISPGWELAEIPVALVVKPFDSDANWETQRTAIHNLNLPPIKVASHFIQFWGLTPVGPAADWAQLEFWAERALRRLGDLGVAFAGVYGGFFKVSENVSRLEAMDQAIRWVNMLADYGDKYNVKIMLEPTADPHTMFPMYLDGLNFVKKEIGRPSVRLMADINYFIAGKQPFEHIAEEPSYCLHVHVAGDNAQPGVGDLEDIHTRFFRVLRDVGYVGGVSAACPWVSTTGSESVDFRHETAKSLQYLSDLREKVYSE